MYVVAGPRRQWQDRGAVPGRLLRLRLLSSVLDRCAAMLNGGTYIGVVPSSIRKQVGPIAGVHSGPHLCGHKLCYRNNIAKRNRLRST